ncbi:MAG: hypothetical protein ACRDRA_12185 [Pseudonocardiaceae bacterium]
MSREPEAIIVRQSSRAHHQADAQRLRRTGQPMVAASVGAAGNAFAVSTAPLALPVTSYADTVYLEAVQQHIWHIAELDNRFGGSDLAQVCTPVILDDPVKRSISRAQC